MNIPTSNTLPAPGTSYLVPLNFQTLLTPRVGNARQSITARIDTAITPLLFTRLAG